MSKSLKLLRERKIFVIKCKGVTKRFDKFEALGNLSLTVPRGSVFGLVGPNGAGKTTLLKSIMGILKCDEGEILVDGLPAYENPEVKEKIFYIPDDLYFFQSYSIKEMADFYKGIYKNFNMERFLKLGAVFEIDLKRNVTRLSNGMQKQVMFWLGISAMPEILILDEPVDGLDPVMRKRVWSVLLQDVAERKTTVLISSHNLRELEDVCDHVGMLSEGEVVIQKGIDDVKGNFHKLQLAYSGEIPKEVSEEIEIVNKTKFGSVNLLIVKGEAEKIKEAVMKTNPLIFDMLPLTLEEVFIYEMGGLGYEIKKADI